MSDLKKQVLTALSRFLNVYIHAFMRDIGDPCGHFSLEFYKDYEDVIESYNGGRGKEKSRLSSRLSIPMDTRKLLLSIFHEIVTGGEQAAELREAIRIAAAQAQLPAGNPAVMAHALGKRGILGAYCSGLDENFDGEELQAEFRRTMIYIARSSAIHMLVTDMRSFVVYIKPEFVRAKLIEAGGDAEVIGMFGRPKGPEWIKEVEQHAAAISPPPAVEEAPAEIAPANAAKPEPLQTTPVAEPAADLEMYDEEEVVAEADEDDDTEAAELAAELAAEAEATAGEAAVVAEEGELEEDDTYETESEADTEEDL